MTDEIKSKILKAKGQTQRLSAQHLKSGGVAGIFGTDARKLDADIKPVVDAVVEALKEEFPNLEFRTRNTITKAEIHRKLNELDERLGVKLFVPTANIQPDGKVTEVKDSSGQWRIILVGECKYQGKDIENVPAGERTSVMEEKGQYLMPAGNAIERVHKNIQEIRNLMIQEDHFPYVVFLQGSNFATEPIDLYWPDGTLVQILASDPRINRIDRVTASNYGMNINENHCKNLAIERDGRNFLLQIPSIYAQSHAFTSKRMFEILFEVALTSLEVLDGQL